MRAVPKRERPAPGEEVGRDRWVGRNGILGYGRNVRCGDCRQRTAPDGRPRLQALGGEGDRVAGDGGLVDQVVVQAALNGQRRGRHGDGVEGDGRLGLRRVVGRQGLGGDGDREQRGDARRG